MTYQRSEFTVETDIRVRDEVAQWLGDWHAYLGLWPLQKKLAESELGWYQLAALNFWDDFIARIDREPGK